MTNDLQSETISDASPELMYVQCAGCGEWLDVKPGRINAISHGLCEDCLELQLKVVGE